MNLFSGSRLKKWILPVLLLAALCSCNVPDPVPTATMTPDWTATPVPPTATPLPTNTPTPTPLPAWLDVRPDDLTDTEIIIRYSLDGKVRDTLEELITRFNEENQQGITLKAERAYSMDELSKITAADSTEKTDLIIAPSAYLRSRNADEDLLMELSDFLNYEDLSLSGEGIEPIMPVMLQTENLDGRYFALPLWTEPAFLFYNKTWAIELGFSDTPANLAEFAEQACAAGKASYAEKDEKKHGTGGWIVSSDPEDVISWLLVFAKDQDSVADLLQSETGDVFTDTASWLRNLFDNGCAWNSRVKEPYDYFANRYALFYSGTYSDAERQFNAFEQSENNGFDNWDLVVYPAKTSDSDENPRIYADGTSIAIIKGEDAKRANAAWHFIRWLYRDTHAAGLAIAAPGWAVQDSDEITRLYRNSGEDKLYQTLSYRQYQVDSGADENRITDLLILSDGFAYVFNPSVKPESIPDIWEQIGSAIAEVNDVNQLSETVVPESTNQTGVNDETQP